MQRINLENAVQATITGAIGKNKGIISLKRHKTMNSLDITQHYHRNTVVFFDSEIKQKVKAG